MPRRRVSIRVSGRVQGVGFRYAAVTEARRHGISGWIRNTPAGEVEGVAEGTPAAIEAFLAWCGHGPPGARVTAVQVREDPPSDSLGEFAITR